LSIKNIFETEGFGQPDYLMKVSHQQNYKYFTSIHFFFLVISRQYITWSS